MRRTWLFSILAAALTLTATGVRAQGDGGYRLVPNWPKLPPGEFFGLKNAPPPPAEREAQAAARRATGRPAGGAAANPGGPTNQPGISGVAIDAQDRIYVFNRGAKPVMVFDTAGNLVMAGGDQSSTARSQPQLAALGRGRLGGQCLHDRATRIASWLAKLDKFLMQLGTTEVKGNDAALDLLASRC